MVVFGVIVTYNPDDQLDANVAAVVSQVDRLIIVDNASSASGVQRLEALRKRYPKLDVHLNNDNLGIGAALNIAFRVASAESADWVLTLDQDSKLATNGIQRMLAALAEMDIERGRRVGLLAPSVTLRGKLGDGPQQHDKRACIRRTVVITSGNLVRVAAFSAIGGYDERLFIDSVDFDFCLRLIIAGYTIYQVNEVVLEHSLGTVSTGRFLGLNLRYTSYGSLRRYYQFRNRLYLYRQFWRRFPRWVFIDALLMSTDAFKALCLEHNRAAMRSALFHGVVDGLGKRLGRVDSWPYPS